MTLGGKYRLSSTPANVCALGRLGEGVQTISMDLVSRRFCMSL